MKISIFSLLFLSISSFATSWQHATPIGAIDSDLGTSRFKVEAGDKIAIGKLLTIREDGSEIYAPFTLQYSEKIIFEEGKFLMVMGNHSMGYKIFWVTNYENYL